MAGFRRRRFSLMGRKRKEKNKRYRIKTRLSNDGLKIEIIIEKLLVKLGEFEKGKSPPASKEMGEIEREFKRLQPLLNNFFIQTIKCEPILGKKTADDMRHVVISKLQALFTRTYRFQRKYPAYNFKSLITGTKTK